MRENEARAELLKGLSVSRQLVTLAKAFLLLPERPPEFEPENQMEEFAKQQGHPRVQRVVLNERVDSQAYIDQAAAFHTYAIAFVKALWGLIYAGHYMAHGSLRKLEPHQGWTTVVPGSGGQTGGWDFPEAGYVLPSLVLRSPVWRQEKQETITDPDLFLLEAGMDGADPEVVEALQDAVCCLRYELYRPSVTLLGKAMEGAWIELGIALAESLDSSQNHLRHGIIAKVKDENRSIARKIADVKSLYERHNLLEIVFSSAGLRPEQLTSVVIWSDVVREARNAIHFGTKPVLANTYEKVVVLFLEGAKALGLIYRIVGAARQHHNTQP
jgi:hypothetical protein